MNRATTNFDVNTCGPYRSFFAWSQITPPRCAPRSRAARAAPHIINGTKSPPKGPKLLGNGAAGVEEQVGKAIEAGRLALAINEVFRAISLRDVLPVEISPEPDGPATSKLPRPG